MDHGIPYLPIWYLMQGLNTVGMESHWLAQDWFLSTPVKAVSSIYILFNRERVARVFT